MRKGHIFFISWIAWAWKGTLIKELLKEDSLNLKLSLSCKTRKPRSWEILWVDYIYMTEKEFKEAINKWEFLEYNYIHNQAYYWTRIKDILDDWINTWKNIIKEVDILILPKILQENKIPKDDYTYIFIDIPLNLVKERMIDRWDDVSWDDYKNRFESAKKEKELLYLADYVIDWSMTREEVLKEAKSIIINNISK